jgi:hypothetical protein
MILELGLTLDKTIKRHHARWKQLDLYL